MIIRAKIADSDQVEREMKNIQDARNIIEQAVDILHRKSQDYGTQNITLEGQSGVATRMIDKVMRIKNLLGSGDNANFESIEDTFIDLLNYSVIGVLLSKGKWKDSTSSIVYLAGPVDSVDFDSANQWRDKVARELRGIVTCFNPVLAFAHGDEGAAKKVVDINRFAIQKCDVVLANLSYGLAFESIREIEYARTIGKPVICVVGSYVSFGMYDLQKVKTIEEAIAALKLSLGVV